MGDYINARTRPWFYAGLTVFGLWALVEFGTMNSARNLDSDKVIELYGRSGGNNVALAANIFVEQRRADQAQARLIVAVLGLFASAIGLYLTFQTPSE